MTRPQARAAEPTEPTEPTGSIDRVALEIPIPPESDVLREVARFPVPAA